MFHKITVHDVVFLLLSFICVTNILIRDNITIYSLICLLALCNIILFKQVKYKYIGWFLLTIIPGLLVMFVVAIIFSRHNTGEYVVIDLLHYQAKIYRTNLIDALSITLRVLSLSICSFIFILHIDIENLTICAMKNLHLPVKFGYAILVVRHAFKFLQQEALRISTVYKIRYCKRISLYRILLPVIISATRYANTCGISLETRGLNDEKTFITKCAHLQLKDIVVLVTNLILIILLNYFVI
jgi:energy-coupling factor transporter transmembrane protein EcfT